MFYLKKYFKFLILFVIFIIIILISYLENKNDSVHAKTDKKSFSIIKEEKNSEEIVVDIKGAVQKPGVYSLSNGKRIIDLINKAGGLLDSAYTININLSKKLEDEMVVIIYTKDELLNYKKENIDTSEVKCVKEECICPNSNNSGCISEKKTTNSKEKKVTTKKSNSTMVSINSGTKEELMTLTGIGEAKANAIIKYREENGAFNSIEDIKKVTGIGDSLFEKIKNNIVL